MDAVDCYVCGKFLEGAPSIECIKCKQWFHKSCVDETGAQGEPAANYVCIECTIPKRKQEISMDDSEMSDCSESSDFYTDSRDADSDSDEEQNFHIADIRALENNDTECAVIDDQNNQWLSQQPDSASSRRATHHDELPPTKLVKLQPCEEVNSISTSGQSVLGVSYFCDENEGKETYCFDEENVPLIDDTEVAGRKKRQARSQETMLGLTASGNVRRPRVHFMVEKMEPSLPPAVLSALPSGKWRAIDIFTRLFDDEIISQIVSATNEYALKIAKRRGQAWTLLTNEEMLGVIGILVCMACFNCVNLPLSRVWSHEYGINLISSTMSLDRYCSIMRLLRLERDEIIAAGRAEKNVIIPIKSFWQKLLENFRINLIPSQNLTLDELVAPCGARSPLKMVVPASKSATTVVGCSRRPPRCGLQLVVVADTQSRYVHNAAVCLPVRASSALHHVIGQSGFMGPPTDRGLDCALPLLRPYHGTERNISLSRQFTDVSLAEYLLSKQLTVVGEISTLNKEVPKVLCHKERTVGSSISLFRSGVQLLSYCPRKGKLVRLLTTLHKEKAEGGTGRAPESIQFYNKTRETVEAVEAGLSGGSGSSSVGPCIRRETKRWTTAFFYTALDLALANAHTLLATANSSGIKRIGRMEFLLELCEQLCGSHREAARTAEAEAAAEAGPIKKEPVVKGRCHVCLLRKRKTARTLGKIQQKCDSCEEPVCPKHRQITCMNCSQLGS